MIYGYARVSSRSQLDNYSLEQQEQEILQKYPDAIIYREQFTGTTVHRPIFQELIGKMQKGDMLVVTKLDRFARTTSEGIELVKKLFECGVSIHVFNIGLLENTTMGNFYLQIMLAVAELERNNIVERTQNGKAIARKKPGFKDGRKKIEVPEFKKYYEKNKKGEISVVDCCAMLGISRAKWYRLCKGES
ncbi:MAG: recombinase family protein [Clostridia bacterium]|nr:recombinase family protein [Clostridia bacterium]